MENNKILSNHICYYLRKEFNYYFVILSKRRNHSVRNYWFDQNIHSFVWFMSSIISQSFHFFPTRQPLIISCLLKSLFLLEKRHLDLFSFIRTEWDVCERERKEFCLFNRRWYRLINETNLNFSPRTKKCRLTKWNGDTWLRLGSLSV